MRPTRPVRPATALIAAVIAGALAAVGVPAAGAAAQRITATPKTVKRTAIQTVRGSGWPVIEFCSRTIRVSVRSPQNVVPIAQRHVTRQRPLRVPLGPEEQEHRHGRLDAGRQDALRERQGRLDASSSRASDAHHHQLGSPMGDGWDAGDIPDQTGRIAVVTGANSGLGLVTARELARHGALVVMACRNLDKGRAAQAEVAAAAIRPQARAGGAWTWRACPRCGRSRSASRRTTTRLDLLINNAGVMAPPRRHTADGFELQFGTNHLGHFALTNLLLPLMEGREDARVVTLSSTAHKTVRGIAFDNLNGDRRYFRWNAYGQSKLANLLFALELDRRLRAAGVDRQEPRRPPRLRGHEPPERRGAAGGPDRHEGQQRGDRPGRRDGRAAAALRRHPAGRRGRHCTSARTASASSAATRRS